MKPEDIVVDGYYQGGYYQGGYVLKITRINGSRVRFKYYNMDGVELLNKPTGHVDLYLLASKVTRRVKPKYEH
jgi:hypothetical protein